MLRRIGRTSSIRVSAKGLGCMRPPTRTISGSPTWSRSRASAWLIADGVFPSASAAPATLPSDISASNTTRRFRSIR
jgi:hypothetical protein